LQICILKNEGKIYIFQKANTKQSGVAFSYFRAKGSKKWLTSLSLTDVSYKLMGKVPFDFYQ
jgi:hypothetical protein